MREKRINILMKGFYGKKNLGDEIILTTILNNIKSKHGIKIDLMTADESFRFRSENIECFGTAETMRKNVFKTLKILFMADYVFLGGGGLFPNDHPLSGNLLLILIAAVLGKKIIIFGVGINPITNNVTKFFWTIILSSRKLKLISVRDELSQKSLLVVGRKLSESKVIKSADIAFSFSSPADDWQAVLADLEIKNNTRYCLFNFAMPWNLFVESDSQYKEHVVKLSRIVKFVSDRGMVPILNSFFDGKDDLLISDVVANIKLFHFDYIDATELNLSCFQKWALFSFVDFSVNFRFHSVVFSAMHKVPSVAVAYDYKTESLMDELGLVEFCSKAGFGKTAFSEDVPDLNEEEIYQKISKADYAAEEIKKKLSLVLPNLQNDSRKNFTLLTQVLDQTYVHIK